MKRVLYFLIPSLLITNFSLSQRIGYSATGNAEFLIIDPLGRKSGYDKVLSQKFDEIPGTVIGSAAYYGPEDDPIPEIDNLVDAHIDPALEGTYTFIIFGDSLSKGLVQTFTFFSDRGTHSNPFVESIVDSGLNVTAKLNFKDNDRSQTKLWKEISEDYLRRSLLAMRKANWIKDDATRDKYLAIVSEYYTYIANNDLAQARIVLDDMQKELNADKSSRLVDGNVVSMLPADVMQLKTELPISMEKSLPLLLDTLIIRTNTALAQHWIGNQNFTKELINHLDNAKKHLNKKDSLKCAREVEKFQSKVDREYKEANTRDNRFVTIEGWKSLYYNAQYIIERLVKLPTKPTGTILQQIDELKAEVQNQSKKKNLGGVLLTTSLSLLCDQAKRQLQRADSVETGIYIALFQLFTDEMYDATAALESSRKRLPSLYVKGEAYIALHYRAKYILEVLPPLPSIDLTAQRSQKVDRQLLNEMEQIKKEVK